MAVTNRTDAPAEVAEGQFMLFVGELHSESVEVEEKYGPRSFLVNLGTSVSPLEPEGLFYKGEYGVIRTYA